MLIFKTPLFTINSAGIVVKKRSIILPPCEVSLVGTFISCFILNLSSKFFNFVLSIYEQLIPIYDNVSGTSKKKLSQYGHQKFNVFSNIANCFWKGVHVFKNIFPK